ncbi:MAG TPA: malonate decarboxylase holo-ACP synthase [Candidatus Sulfotelmatobacter sp.]
MSTQSAKHGPRVHDVVRIDPAALRPDVEERPPWAGDMLSRAPFAVIRRGTSPTGMLPVGIRGAERAQRWAAFCSVEGFLTIYRPEDLLHRGASHTRLSEAPAFDALKLLRDRWEGHSLNWGPTGSVGFELATGCLTVTQSSDLDLVIRADNPLSISDAAYLLCQADGLPAVVDIRVETPFCGFSLCEFVREGSRNILLRYPSAAIIGDYPWRELQRWEVHA